jgi:hypothetical protein
MSENTPGPVFFALLVLYLAAAWAVLIFLVAVALAVIS